MTKKFTTPVAYEYKSRKEKEFIIYELEKLGYMVTDIDDRPYIITNFAGEINVVTTINDYLTFTLCTSIEQFLHLASQTEEVTPDITEQQAIDLLKGLGYVISKQF